MTWSDVMDKPCPLCGRRMTALETYAGRGELYCGHCDLTIGGNDAKTPDELTALLEQRTCKLVIEKRTRYGSLIYHFGCGYDFWQSWDCPTPILKHCPNCGARVVDQ